MSSAGDGLGERIRTCARNCTDDNALADMVTRIVREHRLDVSGGVIDDLDDVAEEIGDLLTDENMTALENALARFKPKSVTGKALLAGARLFELMYGLAHHEF